jgi:hypothetical protein
VLCYYGVVGVIVVVVVVVVSYTVAHDNVTRLECDPPFDAGRLRSIAYRKNLAYGNFIRRVRKTAKSDC